MCMLTGTLHLPCTCQTNLGVEVTGSILTPISRSLLMNWHFDWIPFSLNSIQVQECSWLVEVNLRSPVGAKQLGHSCLSSRVCRLGLCLDGVVFDCFRHGLYLPSIAIVGVGEVLALIGTRDGFSAKPVVWVVPCGSSCTPFPARMNGQYKAFIWETVHSPKIERVLHSNP